MLEMRLRLASVSPGRGRYARYADRLSAVASPGRSPMSSTTTAGSSSSPTSLSTPTRQWRTTNGRPNDQPRSAQPRASSGSRPGTWAATAVADRPQYWAWVPVERNRSWPALTPRSRRAAPRPFPLRGHVRRDASRINFDVADLTRRTGNRLVVQHQAFEVEFDRLLHQPVHFVD